MISRVIVNFNPATVSQRDWDDFCHAKGLALRPTGYFAANGLHAGAQDGRASFFSRDADKTAHIVASFLLTFGGWVREWQPVRLVPAGVR